MSVMSQIILDRFKPRDYQKEIFKALERDGFRKLMCILPRRCISGDSLITMANGTEKLLKDICIGDKVLAWDGRSFQEDKVVNVWKTEEKETVSVKSVRRDPLICSLDHRFACLTGAMLNTPKLKHKFYKTAEFLQKHRGCGFKVVHYGKPPLSYVKDRGGYYAHQVVVKSHGFQELYDMETETHHNFIANGYVVHNSGKDLTIWNLCIREALKKVGIYYYILPTYSQARKTLWDSITNDGIRFLDYIPPEFVAKKNEQEMKITFTNGSILQLCGSKDYDRLMGTNPCGVVFSEYALQDPRAYQYIRPILVANGGWCIFASTVRGKNALWELYNIAKEAKDWFCIKLSVEETKHIPLELIEHEIQSGEMSRDLAMQEYWNDFNLGVEGAYYAKYVDKMRLNNQIGQVPWEPAFKVNIAVDLGMRDSTTIIFFQTIGQTVRIIDVYSNDSKGLEHYAQVIFSKPYQLGVAIAPHDIAVRELGTGMSRLEKSRQLGLDFVIAPSLSIFDGIEAVRTTLPKIWIDEDKCKPLIAALENYRKEYDAKKQIYYDRPFHDKHSHFCDSLRYLCISLSKTQDGRSAEEHRRMKHEAIYGSSVDDFGPFGRNSTRMF